MIAAVVLWQESVCVGEDNVSDQARWVNAIKGLVCLDRDGEKMEVSTTNTDLSIPAIPPERAFQPRSTNVLR